MKKKHIIGLLVMVGFTVFAAGAYRASLTPYISFQEARAKSRTVQVFGKIDENTVRYDNRAGTIEFDLVDETGDTLRVLYKGVRPNNFEGATDVAVIGRYRDGVFYSEKLLIKCPSKYEGGS
ncbi:MAG: cytochrome c maturation protein CcmE [Bacillota bacterium]